MGTSFTMTSQLAGTDFLDETIFARGERGAGAEGRGLGLGLYLVQKSGRGPWRRGIFFGAR